MQRHAFCNSQVNRSKLLTIVNEVSFERVKAIPNISIANVWLNLERINRIPDLTSIVSASEFKYRDGTLRGDFGIISSEFPWNSGEPNNNSGTVVIEPELCVEMIFGTSLLNDISCFKNNTVVCQTECTLSPTKAPTNSPVVLPSTSPTSDMNVSFSPTVSSIAFDVEESVFLFLCFGVCGSVLALIFISLLSVIFIKFMKLQNLRKELVGLSFQVEFSESDL